VNQYFANKARSRWKCVVSAPSGRLCPALITSAWLATDYRNVLGILNRYLLRAGCLMQIGSINSQKDAFVRAPPPKIRL